MSRPPSTLSLIWCNPLLTGNMNIVYNPENLNNVKVGFFMLDLNLDQPHVFLNIFNIMIIILNTHFFF